jgi:hypothetical protein
MESTEPGSGSKALKESVKGPKKHHGTDHPLNKKVSTGVLCSTGRREQDKDNDVLFLQHKDVTPKPESPINRRVETSKATVHQAMEKTKKALSEMGKDAEKLTAEEYALTGMGFMRKNSSDA